jgi:hypothetical protein
VKRLYLLLLVSVPGCHLFRDPGVGLMDRMDSKLQLSPSSGGQEAERIYISGWVDVRRDGPGEIVQVRVPKDLLGVTGGSVKVGETLRVEVRGESVKPVSGMGFAIGYEQDAIEIVSVEPSPWLKELAGKSLFFQWEDQRTHVTTLVFFDLLPPIEVPPTQMARDTPIALITLRAKATGKQFTKLSNQSNVFGRPAIRNAFSSPSGEVLPELSSGTITIVP